MNLHSHSFVQIKKEKNGTNYVFFVPQGAPLGEAYDVFFECLQDIVEMAKKNVEAAQPKEPVEDETKKE